MAGIYGGLLPKAYGTNMDAQRRANTLKPLKQAFSFRNESKTTTLTKSKLCSHGLSCLAMFNDLVWRSRCKKESRSLQDEANVFFDIPLAVSFLIELDIPLCSVSLI